MFFLELHERKGKFKEKGILTLINIGLIGKAVFFFCLRNFYFVHRYKCNLLSIFYDEDLQYVSTVVSHMCESFHSLLVKCFQHNHVLL